MSDTTVQKRSATQSVVQAHDDVLRASETAARESWKLQTAIVSISNKDGLDVLGRIFAKYNVHVIATTGTHASITNTLDESTRSAFELTEISVYTDYPYNLNGRLKTLHPKVQAGVLAIRGFHDRIMKDSVKAEYIDLVVANLYPFDRAVKEDMTFFECIENIDIGGPALIRAGAKNHACVTVVVEPSDYSALESELERSGGRLSPEFRRKMAQKAFKLTSDYDGQIAQWFASKASEKAK
jgi:phosphoribosylaminoimidazolecarboxamide formyltransferase/IMP cyclohydrolase